MNPHLIEKIAVTFELCSGLQLSAPAKKLVIEDLEKYPELSVSKALDICRREVKGRLSPSDIIARVEQMDGRPAPDEAWGLIPMDEARSVCWTSEMCSAFESCRHLLGTDHVAARMAFLSAYRSAVQEARVDGLPVHWELSLGHNQAEREDCAERAVAEFKISRETALMLCPYLDESRLLADKLAPQLERINEPASIGNEMWRVLRRVGVK
jgi:hypothetical protein